MRYTLYMVALAAAMLADGARAQEVRGRVTDAEGRAVEPATVAVFRGDRQLAADVTDTAGHAVCAACGLSTVGHADRGAQPFG